MGGRDGVARETYYSPQIGGKGKELDSQTDSGKEPYPKPETPNLDLLVEGRKVTSDSDDKSRTIREGVRPLNEPLAK